MNAARDPASAPSVSSLSLGFRERYLRYDELTRQLHAWAEAFPEFVRLQSIGKSEGGRDLWLLTIGRDPDRIRPAAWVDGNMHASEVAGSMVALAIAEDVIALHAGDGAVRDLPPHLADLLRDDVLFYVLPRMCPDGAEHMLTVGSFVRSNPRDRRIGRTAPRWRGADVDGDGRARLMRREDPSGQWTASPASPNWLVARTIDDPGPFYVLYPEGYIDDWDGFTIPSYDYLADNDTDMNRNFPFDWAPEPRQVGAGEFAASEPESRAVTAFAVRHPEIFAWLNLHTFGGCFIRPSGDKSDKQMNQSDLWVFQQIERWATPITGYPVLSGFEEFTYEPDTPLYGDLSTFAYEQRGAVAMVCELWDLWKQVGVEVKRPFVMNYSKRTADEVRKVLAWDAAHNASRVVCAWKPFDHPQLGPVEVGGFDAFIGIWNPPPDRLAEVCDRQSRTFLRWAALAPRVRVQAPVVTSLGDDLHRIEVAAQNIGFLPTYVLQSAMKLPWNDAVRMRLSLGEGLTLVSGDEAPSIGHLEGWMPNAFYSGVGFPRSTPNNVRGRAVWIVRGEGSFTVSASCPRTGAAMAHGTIGGATP